MPQKKKIFDIAPPKESGFVQVKQKRAEAPEKKIEIKKEKPLLKKESGRKISFKKTPFVVIGGIVAVCLLAWLLIEPKAEVRIWPQKESKELQTRAIVYEQALASGDIPGSVLEVEKTVSDTFEATGSKLKTARASGVITVYNAYSTNAQPLIVNTRFVSDNGKLFRSPKRITIPGAHYEGGKLVPGTVDVEVIADQPGAEYNIDASTFSLPGLAGTAMYTSIYAKSFEPMTGGAKKEASQVTQEDIDRAEGELTKLALEESKSALEEKLPSLDYVVLKDAIKQEIVEYVPLAKVGQAEAEFVAQATSRAKAMVFKKDNVHEFARNYAASQVPDGWALQENSLQVKYTVEEIKLTENQIILNLDITADIYQTVDEENLREVLKDKTPESISRILGDYSQIKQAKVDLWPFWAKKSPENIECIKIEIMLDPVRNL